MDIFFFFVFRKVKQPQFDMEFRSSVAMSASIAPPKDIGMSLPPGGPVILF